MQNKELLHEHISKLISQNEAIVENKELLLQKKYPKTLNRSRSFNNSNSNNNSNSSSITNNNSSLIAATVASNESANAKLAQAIVQKQQQQQQQMLQQQQQQQQVQQQKSLNFETASNQPPNGIHKHLNINTKPQLSNSSSSSSNIPSLPASFHQAPPSRPQQASNLMSAPQQQAAHILKELPPQSQTEMNSLNSGAPLNLSAKAKTNEDAVPVAVVTPRKRQSLEHQTSSTSSEASSSSSPQANLGNNGKPLNNSIIKNLLLNARGLAVPTGTGEDAVYTCPICLNEFRTAEDLKQHNSTYCQEACGSDPISPASSPSYKYFRSNSLSYLLKNPLPLAKLAWSQLKTKNSSLVANCLSASQAGNSKASANNSSTSVSSSTSNAATVSTSSNAESSMSRGIEAPLPSPGPLLGKTALVDFHKNDCNSRKADEGVVITKMHEDRQFAMELSAVPNKKAKFEAASPEIKHYSSSGGSMIPISESAEFNMSPKLIRTPLHSGGCFQEVSPKPNKEKEATKPKLGLGLPSNNLVGMQHFQYPPINPITAFNPLTLPPLSTAEKIIPYVPGIPGPNVPTAQQLMTAQQHLQLPNQHKRNLSPNHKRTPSPLNNNETKQTKTAKQTLTVETPKKAFNFLRMADNLSPRKNSNNAKPNETEVRNFNFDNVKETAANQMTPLHIETSQPSSGSNENMEAKKTKFLRPTSLPLKPGTFTPKRHHGITPTPNTMLLVSPETPRPSKSCVQLYRNGHAYTYLGLKCSTKSFYCTLNCPQPSYVASNLSMYSMWQVYAESNPHPLGFKPKEVIALYNSHYASSQLAFSMAGADKMCYTLKQSQQIVMTPFTDKNGQFYHHQIKQIEAGAEALPSKEKEVGEEKAIMTSVASSSAATSSSAQMLVGGYESHDDYTYIRGRGRGRYVCSECGIRCKKPSMLKKHIRTHTDVRPYTCKNCNFSFKTKGNLTKHMQSKTHYKKCIELGIHPGPMPADSEFLEPDVEFDQQSSTSAGGRTSSLPGESDSDDFSDNETESSGK